MKRKILTGPRILGALILIAVAVAIAFLLRTPPVIVDIGQVTQGPLTVTVDDLGETRVTNLYVVSAPITGELLRVPLKPGDRVLARSTVLGRIQPLAPAPLDARSLSQNEANVRALSAQLAASLARVEAAQADLRLAERNHARIDALTGRGFVSQANADQARIARDRARAAVAEARQGVDATRHSLEAARAALIVPGSGSSGRGAVTLTAPVSGYVLRVPQESERVVVSGTPLLEIGDPAQLEIVTDLLSADAVRVRPGAPVVIENWGGDRPLRGRVRLVEPFGFTKISALGVEEQRVNAVIDFAEPRQALTQLGHGYRATIHIAVWSAPNVLRVPISALFRTEGRWSLFRVDDDSRARLVQVEVGHMNDEQAEVRGLPRGARVILHPSDRIREGVAVRAGD